MITKDRIKKYTTSWLDINNNDYDSLIDEVIIDAKAFINELIHWEYVPDEINFTEMQKVINNKVFLNKTPLNFVASVKDLDGNNIDYNIDKYYSSSLSICNSCINDVVVEYSVGGYIQEYPRAVETVIIDLVIKKINHYINNANGFDNIKIGNDISSSFNFNLTPEQQMIIARYCDI